MISGRVLTVEIVDAAGKAKAAALHGLKGEEGVIDGAEPRRGDQDHRRTGQGGEIGKEYVRRQGNQQPPAPSASTI